jgi:hypothetical protein
VRTTFLSGCRRVVEGSFLSMAIMYSKINYICLSQDIRYILLYLIEERYSDDESLEAHSVSLALASENPSLPAMSVLLLSP